jgi:hypothetical protein
MRRMLSFAQPLCLVASAAVVMVPNGGWWLPRLAVSIFLCGYAVRWASVDLAWPAGAAILSGLLLTWSVGWVWALRRISCGSPPNQAGSP